MPIEKEPATKIAAGYIPPNSTRYQVKDGDSWVTIARRNGLDVWKLIEANFKTRNPDEVNWYLRTRVGCKVQTKDGKNWMFSSSASPGVIYIPNTAPAPLYYVVPDMKFVAQDQSNSCWYASAQMLIQWRDNSTHSSSMDHPDPATVDTWAKLYAKNSVIQNAELKQFAADLGLEMLGPATPTPEYLRDLLRDHGPVWVNGKTHITVIGGIRRSATGGIEVLVFNPANPAETNGAWHDFDQQYGQTPSTTLDADADSPTSMLYLK